MAIFIIVNLGTKQCTFRFSCGVKKGRNCLGTFGAAIQALLLLALCFWKKRLTYLSEENKVLSANHTTVSCGKLNLEFGTTPVYSCRLKSSPRNSYRSTLFKQGHLLLVKCLHLQLKETLIQASKWWRWFSRCYAPLKSSAPRSVLPFLLPDLCCTVTATLVYWRS